MRIGLIGAGAIGRFLLQEINGKSHSDLMVESVLVRNKAKHQDLEKMYNVTLYQEMEDFLAADPGVVVEAANVEAAQILLPEVIPHKSVVAISIGAFRNAVFYEKMDKLSKQYKQKIHLPSGAIGGLDLLQNANTLGGVEKVTLVTRKPAASLVNRPVEKEEIIFEGSAGEAIHAFPKNMNVSIILSLAGIGMAQTKVQIIADAAAKRNSHSVTVEGDFGRASLTVENRPLPENPKTSYLAAMSLLGALQRLNQSIKIAE